MSAYTELTIEAPDIADTAAPGSSSPSPWAGRRRRCCCAARSPSPGWARAASRWWSARARGSTWLASRRPGTRWTSSARWVARSPPARGHPGAAGGRWLRRRGAGRAGWVLRSRGHEVAAVVGAVVTRPGCVSVEDLAAVAAPFVVTTDDGSAGGGPAGHGPVAELVGGAGVVYACGPMPIAGRRRQVATDRGVPSWVAVEESMACGVGVCMTCVLRWWRRRAQRFARSCTDGRCSPVTGCGSPTSARCRRTWSAPTRWPWRTRRPRRGDAVTTLRRSRSGRAEGGEVVRAWTCRPPSAGVPVVSPCSPRRAARPSAASSTRSST